MSAFCPGNMRGPQLRTPVLLLMLLMLWLNPLTNTVFCQYNEDGYTDSEKVIEEEEDAEEPVTDIITTELYESLATSPAPTEDPGLDSADDHEIGSGDDETKRYIIPNEESPFTNATYLDLTESTSIPDENGLSLTTILIPVVVGVLIISIIVCSVFANRKWSQKVTNKQSDKEDPYLDGSNTDKVPMPMFEEDVPSVLELEMEELDQWMIKKDSGPAESLNQA